MCVSEYPCIRKRQKTRNKKKGNFNNFQTNASTNSARVNFFFFFQILFLPKKRIQMHKLVEGEEQVQKGSTHNIPKKKEGKRIFANSFASFFSDWRNISKSVFSDTIRTSHRAHSMKHFHLIYFALLSTKCKIYSARWHMFPYQKALPYDWHNKQGNLHENAIKFNFWLPTNIAHIKKRGDWDEGSRFGFPFSSFWILCRDTSS